MKFVVIGAGMGGLVAARALRVSHSDADVTIVERSGDVGGLLSGTLYPDAGLYFDQGTHIPRETGNKAIDDFIIGSMPADALIHFPIGEGDLAGAVFDGRLQSNTHFPDIRNRADAGELTSALHAHLAAAGDIGEISRTAPLLETAAKRFGATYANAVLGPMLSHAYQQPVENLAGFAMALPGLSRVVASDFAEWQANVDNHAYRAVISVPNQRDLPEQFRQRRRSFYARKHGSRAVVDAVAARLRSDGVSMLTGSSISDLDLSARTMRVTDPAGNVSEHRADGIVIATGAFGAAHMLGVSLPDFGFDRPMDHRIINLLLDAPVESDLCYLYGLDTDSDYYRVTNYRAFSGDATDRRLTVEVLGDRGVAPEALPSHVVGQLRDIGLLSSAGFEFSDVRKLAAGFPVPTVRNMTALGRLGDHINAILPDRVVLGGIGARNGQFFQNEIVEDIYASASKLIQ